MQSVILSSPLTFCFLLLFAGCALAGLKTKGFSLGASYILFLSILVGFLVKSFSLAGPDYGATLPSTAKLVSSLGAALFVSVIGFSGGQDVKRGAKGGICAFLVGGAMSLFGVLLAHVLLSITPSLSPSSMLGILCGALTSTPGLAAVCELSAIRTEETVLSYSCAYLSGVVTAVFAARCATKRKTAAREAEPPKATGGKAPFFETLSLLSLAAFLGTLLGGIKLPCLNTSMGSTCGMLIASLLLGLFTRWRKREHSFETLTALRSLGLAVFFVGTGLGAGLQIEKLYLPALLFGALLSLSTVGFGYAILRLFSPFRSLHPGCILAGGMTSSPALGETVRRDPAIPVDQFSFAYLGALLTLSISIPLLA